LAENPRHKFISITTIAAVATAAIAVTVAIVIYKDEEI
jgi:hypothetical protein